MRFIRKNGRIIPIKEKKDGNVDKRHVSDKGLAEAARRLKPNKTAQISGVTGGSIAGGLFGLRKGGLIVGGVGALIGGLAGKAVGSMRLTNKQEVANKLKRKAKKK